jgi:Uma2 family endonuclease
MEPVGCKYGQYNVAIFFELGQWNKQKKLGVVFGSSAGFTLPNGAVRSPDASWISKERDRMLSKEEKETFAPICPDFVVELKSPQQTLRELQAKMEEYMENGARLGWLIDMDEERIWIYEEGKEVRLCEGLKGKLSGEPYLPGFALDLDELKRLKEE